MSAVPCQHWSDCGIIGGGCCALKLFGGRPSLGVCDRCEHNPDHGKMPPAAPLTIGGILHGAAGIAKALTGTGGADQPTIDARTTICVKCDQAETVGGMVNRCKLCGCATWAKIRNKDERCPLGKW